MQRLYVSPNDRSQEVVRTLAGGIISEACQPGYARMLLDTLPQMVITLTAAAAMAFSPLDIVSTLALAGGVGIVLWHAGWVGASE